MSTAGRLIWISLRPIIRLFLTSLCGFTITKLDLFPSVAARGTGQLLINIALPCLFFSRIVTSISVHNASAIGPLVLVAFIYQALGFVLALAIKQVFWVPHRFRYGILVAGVFSNWGDIPNAILTSVTLSAPFRGQEDSDVAVAYIAVVILIFSVTLFPLGAHNLIAWDFKGPDVEDEDVRMVLKHKHLFRGLRLRTSGDVEKDAAKSTDQDKKEPGTSDMVFPMTRTMSSSRYTTLGQSSSLPEPLDRVVSPDTYQTVISDQCYQSEPTVVDNPIQSEPIVIAQNDIPISPPVLAPQRRNIKRRIKAILKEWLTPCCIAVLSGILIALVTPVKALFVPNPSSKIPNAPDGQPPLAFLLDTTNFIGNAAVPMGLICLGSALARMRLPNGMLRGLPLGAIGSLAIGKMILMPVLGFLISQGLTSAGIIDRNDKVLRFVCIVISATPTATTQVYMTQVYSGTGSAEHLSPFLLTQYSIMIFSTTALIAFTMQLLF